VSGRPGQDASRRWTLRTARTSYTVELPAHGRWPELSSWGPHGVEDGPSPLALHGRTPYLTTADAAPAEYIPFGLRPFTGADLVGGPAGGERGLWWDFDGEEDTPPGGLRLAFADPVAGLRAVLCYETVPGTDVIRRWTELTCTGERELRLERIDSAAVTVPAPHGARLTCLTGQWAQEFQPTHVDLTRGRFEIGSTQAVPGHAHAPWLAVRPHTAPPGPPAPGRTTEPAWGVALAWPGDWRITADAEAGGLLRVRAGRVPHEGAVLLAPGETLTTPALACAHSPDGLDGLARVWHAYDRALAGERLRRPRPVLYNSWEATEFDVEEAGQLALARIAADLGAELFVVDDGWFTGRRDDTGGLGDWHPDPAAFPRGFGRFAEDVRALGLDVGLWVEPEAVSPTSRLYAQHPEWVYHLDGRPATLIRNQLLLDLGREDVHRFVVATLDRLLRDHPISYLKWDMNRPATERGRPGAGPPERLDLDGAHAANYLRVLDHLRAAHPHVTVEGCAAGGARIEHATIARTDVVWPSDNTAPLDRLTIQHGFLHAHAPHLMSSWVTDAPGFFDPRPRSLRFRFVTAMAGVLGIGADIRAWTPPQRAEAARWIARYKEIRDVVHHGEAHLIGSPADPSCAVQYTAGARVAVLAWSTGRLDGGPRFPRRPDRLPLRGLDTDARYVDKETGARYSGAHLTYVGLPFTWTAELDADVVVLDMV
jgi:alpha-galactosidase